ncbi:caspase family protein [Amycolatopsis sp. cmx-4-68]|uniref:caspase family protein n=1 Tax=Amycolatopsis sp. cmx-4-68 TaxID=2790938 RepID=UPI00397DCAEA
MDSQHYDGWAGALLACENDARDMAAIARSQGFDATVLLTHRARSDEVLRAIQDAARTLRAGDVFLITYAGHGARIADQNADEPDRQDETWVLYDRMLIDDEIDSAFARFTDGVRVITVLDSCHSASATRRPQDAQARLMPEAVLKQTLAQHNALYQGIRRARDPHWSSTGRTLSCLRLAKTVSSRPTARTTACSPESSRHQAVEGVLAHAVERGDLSPRSTDPSGGQPIAVSAAVALLIHWDSSAVGRSATTTSRRSSTPFSCRCSDGQPARNSSASGTKAR